MEVITAEQLIEFDMNGLLQEYLKYQQIQEQLDAALSVIKDEMITRLDAEHVKGKMVGDYQVTKVTRVNYRPTLDQARELAATKMVEQVDTQALRRLHEQGIEIPNTSVTTFVMVKPVEQLAA